MEKKIRKGKGKRETYAARKRTQDPQGSEEETEKEQEKDRTVVVCVGGKGTKIS